MKTPEKLLDEKGFLILGSVFSQEEINRLIKAIANADRNTTNFRQSNGLFAIRRFFFEIPEVKELIFTPKLREVIHRFLGENFFLVKSIYFDKPEASNWFVSYHQDLTISVDQKTDIAGYGPWTTKQDQFAVQPPLHILENIYTIRIHLDDTDENNGALKVIPASHLHGVRRIETIDLAKENGIICDVAKGGIMIMRPLLFHSSARTTNNHQRRVIHLEFSNAELAGGLVWSERSEI